MSEAPWTPAEIDALVTLWNDGVSASQIAKQLKRPSRSAICGKVHRLRGQGVYLRAAPPIVKTARTTPPKTNMQNRGAAKSRKPTLKIAGRGQVFEEAEAQAPRLIVAATAFEPIPNTEPVPFMRRSRLQCSWHVGGDVGPDMLCCGLPVADDGGPEFCPTHREACRNKHTRKYDLKGLMRLARAA